MYSATYVMILGVYYKLQTFLYMPANGIIQFIVDTFSVNIPISLSGMSRHTTVPASMIPTFNASVMVNIFFTLACSPAP